MEELTEMLTWSKLGLHSKPMGLLNVDGYYDHFLEWVGWRGISVSDQCLYERGRVGGGDRGYWALRGT